MLLLIPEAWAGCSYPGLDKLVLGLLIAAGVLKLLLSVGVIRLAVKALSGR